MAFLTPSLHSSDILRASLSRRASESAGALRGGAGGDSLIKTLSATSSISASSSSGVSVPSASSTTGSKMSAEMPVISEPHCNSSDGGGCVGDIGSGVGDTSAAIAAMAASHKNSVASNVLLASNKKTKFLMGKPERHKSEAAFVDAGNATTKTANRPAHSVIGMTEGFEGKAGSNNNGNNNNNNNNSKRPLSLELEQKTTEAGVVNANNPTTSSNLTTTSTSSRGYREIISPSSSLAAPSSSSSSGIAETPRGRRAGKQLTASAAPDMKVMIVWLHSYEDRAHFPAAELFHGHCLTGAEPHVIGGGSRSGSIVDAEGSASATTTDSLNLFIIFVHPLENGLFRVNLQSPASRASAMMAIPAVSGMVLSRRLLGLVLRQTVINICQRKRLDDADVNQPPHVRRRYKIQDIAARYHEQMADAELLTSLFREMPQKF